MAQRLQLVHGCFERLSRRVALSGLFSRKEAEAALREGRITVGGVVATTNHQVPDAAPVRVDDVRIPEPCLRVWGFNKPRKVLCVMEEKDGIMTLPELFRQWQQGEAVFVGKTLEANLGHDHRSLRHFNIVHPLPVQHEGIVLLTNCGVFAEALRAAENNVESVYMVRVSGASSTTPELFRPWRHGVTAHGKYMGRVLAQMVRRAENSAWIKVHLVERPEAPLETLFSSVGLSMTRLRRLAFGPYLGSKVYEEQLVPLKVHRMVEHLAPVRTPRTALVPLITSATQNHDDVAVRVPGGAS